MSRSCNFNVLLDLEYFAPYLPTMSYEKRPDTLAFIDNYIDCDIQTHMATLLPTRPRGPSWWKLQKPICFISNNIRVQTCRLFSLNIYIFFTGETDSLGAFYWIWNKSFIYLPLNLGYDMRLACKHATESIWYAPLNFVICGKYINQAKSFCKVNQVSGKIY